MIRCNIIRKLTIWSVFVNVALHCPLVDDEEEEEEGGCEEEEEEEYSIKRYLIIPS